MQLDLMGIKINTESKGQILKTLEDRFKSGVKTFLATPYSEFFYYRATNYDFRRALESADILIPDGISVLWLAQYLSLALTAKNFQLKIIQAFWQLIYTNLQIIFAPKRIRKIIPQKISGSDFFWDLMALAEKNNWKIYLLGGFGETPKIVAEKIKVRFKKIAIAGYSNADPNTADVKAINDSGADLIAVAFGPVRQEIWISQNLEKLQTKIAIGVGGTFDYIAGAKSQPPQFVRNAGLEWFYRLITQGRFKRIWIATYLFLRGALRYKVFMSMPFRQSAVGVIINRENKVFVGRSAREKSRGDSGFALADHWQLPQGGIERGENPEAGVLREIREETGLTKLKILGTAQEHYSYIWPHVIRPVWSNRLKFKGQLQTIYFLKQESEEPVTLDPHEFMDYKWIDIKDLQEAIHPVRRQMLKIALAEINKYV